MSAHAAPEIYGRAIVTLDLQSGDGDNVYYDVADAATVGTKRVEKRSKDGQSQLTSKGSYVGFRGTEAISPEMNVIYQLEYGVNVDNNVKNFAPRETFIGVEHARFGTLKAGRLNAIDSEIDHADVSRAGVLGGWGVLADFDGDRMNNAFTYVSPELHSTKALAMYVINEKTAGATQKEVFGIGAVHELNKQARGGVAYIKSGKFSSARVSGSYDVKPDITVGALYQNTKFETGSAEERVYRNAAESTFVISGKMKTATPWKPYAQLDLVQNAKGYKGLKRQRALVGATYAFNAKTTGHLYGAMLKDDTNEIGDTEYKAGVFSTPITDRKSVV